MIDPTTSLAFALYENPGVFALLIGSGISRAAQIPTGWELIIALTRRVAALEGVENQIDWAAWYQQRFGEPPNYSRLIDSLAQTAEERRAILHTFIEPSAEDIAEGRRVPTKAHRAIAKLVSDGVIKIIVTTNFDRLLETALQDAGIQPIVIKSDDDLKGALPLAHSRCFLLKVHGDYLDSRIRNTEGELTAYSNEMDAILDRIFDEYGLLICGWSADWDPALRAAIARAPNRRFPMFLATKGTPSQPAKDLIQLRAGRAIEIKDADSFFDEIAAKVEIQRALQKSNPLTVEMLVATVKRYLVRPEFRIQLSDLIREECAKIRDQVAEASLEADGAWSQLEFRRRVARYEAIMEPLCRVFIAMGRWGDDTEISPAQDVLRSFAERPFQGGLMVWGELRAFPAVLLLYAYGIGAAKGGRYRALKEWLATTLRQSMGDERKSAVEALFLWSWRGGEDNTWKQLDGFERHKTPLSDHLVEFFSPLLERELIAAIDVAASFERFEVLAAISYLTESSSKATLVQALASQGQQNFVWVPVGRTAWNREARIPIMAELDETRLRTTLLDAGFAEGDSDFFTAIRENIGRVMGRVGGLF